VRPDLPGLRSVPLFSDLPAEALRALRAHLRRLHLRPAATLFREGDRGSSCFIVIDGELEVHKALPSDRAGLLLARCGPGSLVGHLALLDYQPRSASCHAGEAGARVLEMDRPEFDRLFSARHPFAMRFLDQVSADIAARLRGVTNQLLAAHSAPVGERRAAAHRAAQRLDAVRGEAAIDLARLRQEIQSEIHLTPVDEG
jgi:CRP/FNR family cyclic AMP-dependent transcriptional regulator